MARATALLTLGLTGLSFVGPTLPGRGGTGAPVPRVAKQGAAEGGSWAPLGYLDASEAFWIDPTF